MSLLKVFKSAFVNKIMHLKIKLMNWHLGQGFKMPEPLPNHLAMYEYCKKMLDGSDDTIYAYEEKIKEYQAQFNNASREYVLKLWTKAFEEVYERKEDM